MTAVPPSRAAAVREAVATELVLAHGFPLSTAELVRLLDGTPRVVSARHGPTRAFRREDVVAALTTMQLTGDVARAVWPGHAAAGPATPYWVLPGTPWDERARPPR